MNEDANTNNTQKRPSRSFIATALCAFAAVIVAACILLGKFEPVNVIPNRDNAQSTPAAAMVTAAPSASAGATAEPTAAPEFVKTAVVVDGESVAVLSSYEAAVTLLDEVLEHYRFISNASAAEFMNQVELVKAAGDAEADASSEAYERLTSQSTPFRVRCRLTESELKPIPYSTKVEENGALMKGMRVVKRYGREGRHVKTTESVLINGVVEETRVTEDYVAIEAVDAVISVGTLEPRDGKPGPDEGKKGRDAGNLEFIRPIEGSIALNFGRYNGSMHLGLDYSSLEGADVVASCSGTVTCLMERGGYGLVVEIDHGNGFLTRYAKLSGSLVKLGDRVEQGQTVGTAGELESGGFGLHFELRIDGFAFNPRYYLKEA